MFDELPEDVNPAHVALAGIALSALLLNVWCSCRANSSQEDEAPLTEMVDLEAQDDPPKPTTTTTTTTDAETQTDSDLEDDDEIVDIRKIRAQIKMRARHQENFLGNT